MSQNVGGRAGADASRAATEQDLPALSACLSSAFFADPVWGGWAFLDPARRPESLAALMGFWAAVAVRHGWVRMTPGAETVAVWIPPNEPEMTAEEEVSFDELLDRLFAGRAGELRALFEQFEEHHPSSPHFYLSLWGTDREYAGRGLGAGLIRENLARIDAAGMPSYLESTNPANLPRYEALGFVPRSEFGPPGGPVITTMWREPAG